MKKALGSLLFILVVLCIIAETAWFVMGTTGLEEQFTLLEATDPYEGKTDKQISVENSLLKAAPKYKTQQIMTEPMTTDESNRYIYEFYAENPDIMLSYSPKTGRLIMGQDDSEYVGFYIWYLSRKSGAVRAQEVNERVEQIVKKAERKPTDKEALLFVLDWFEKNCEYTETPMNMWDASLYGCIVDGRATCVGYAESLHLVMTRLGIPCEIVVDTVETNHAWNKVKIDGKTLKVDVTALCRTF